MCIDGKFIGNQAFKLGRYISVHNPGRYVLHGVGGPSLIWWDVIKYALREKVYCTTAWFGMEREISHTTGPDVSRLPDRQLTVLTLRQVGRGCRCIIYWGKNITSHAIIYLSYIFLWRVWNLRWNLKAGCWHIVNTIAGWNDAVLPGRERWNV